MRYELLGPLRVIDGDRIVLIHSPKIEVLLATLLIRADQVVTAENLIAEIWGDAPPSRATAGLHVYISQLRKILSGMGNPIVTRPPGYLLRLGSDEFDVHTFLRLTNTGRERVREGRDECAVTCFTEALSLWRGPVLGSSPGAPIVSGFVTWLTEARLECEEMMIEVCLRLGRHRELVGYLHSLIAEHPLREDFYRQLMLALYRSQRQADALRVYQLARRRLRRELGLEPGPALQDLHRAILWAADDRLDVAAPA